MIRHNTFWMVWTLFAILIAGLFPQSAAATYIHVSSTLCIANCTLGPDLTPECSMSRDRCCSPNIMGCTNFYTCMNERLLSVFCPSNHGFQESSLRCRKGHVCNPECSKRCSGNGCLEECCFPDPDNCKYFHTCNNNRTSLNQCPDGSNFDEYSLSCIPGYQCFIDDPAPCPQPCNSTSCNKDCCIPFPTCGSEYIVCKNGIQTKKTCPQNTKFNPTTLVCDEEMFKECLNTQISTTVRTVGGRRLLSKEEFLSAIYAVYTRVGEQLTVEIN